MQNKLSGIFLVLALALGATKAGATLTDDPCDDGVGPACTQDVISSPSNDSETAVMNETGMEVMQIAKFEKGTPAAWSGDVPNPGDYTLNIAEGTITMTVGALTEGDEPEADMGSWSSPNKVIDYVVVKAGQKWDLYDYTGSNAVGDVWSTINLDGKSVSHISFYMKMPVPEPSTFLLVGFGIGVAGLAGYRERKKKS